MGNTFFSRRGQVGQGLSALVIFIIVMVLVALFIGYSTIYAQFKGVAWQQQSSVGVRSDSDVFGALVEVNGNEHTVLDVTLMRLASEETAKKDQEQLQKGMVSTEETKKIVARIGEAQAKRAVIDRVLRSKVEETQQKQKYINGTCFLIVHSAPYAQLTAQDFQRFQEEGRAFALSSVSSEGKQYQVNDAVLARYKQQGMSLVPFTLAGKADESRLRWYHGGANTMYLYFGECATSGGKT